MSTGTETSFQELIKSAEEAFNEKDFEKTVEIMNQARKCLPDTAQDDEIERIHRNDS